MRVSGAPASGEPGPPSGVEAGLDALEVGPTVEDGGASVDGGWDPGVEAGALEFGAAEAALVPTAEAPTLVAEETPTRLLLSAVDAPALLATLNAELPPLGCVPDEDTRRAAPPSPALLEAADAAQLKSAHAPKPTHKILMNRGIPFPNGSNQRQPSSMPRIQDPRMTA